MSFFVFRTYFSLSWNENTSWWILVHQLFLYYILTTSKLHPNYKNVHPNYEKLHPIYEQTTSQLRGWRSENFKKCLISFNWGQIFGKYRHRRHYFCPSFVHTEFCFALRFPFNNYYITINIAILINFLSCTDNYHIYKMGSECFVQAQGGMSIVNFVGVKSWAKQGHTRVLLRQNKIFRINQINTFYGSTWSNIKELIWLFDRLPKL